MGNFHGTNVLTACSCRRLLRMLTAVYRGVTCPTCSVAGTGCRCAG